MFTRADGMDWFVNLRPSMLDEHGWFAPFVETWTSEKLPWAVNARQAQLRDAARNRRRLKALIERVCCERGPPAGR